jgi:RNA polymerase sigma-70 factor (ECF subfamily)
MDDALERYRIDRSPRAAERLVEQYQPLVASVCRRYLRRSQDVEDAVQETFVKLLHHAGAIRGDAQGWLSTTAYSTCVDFIRRISAQRRRLEKIVAPGSPAAEHRVIHEAIAAKLHQALLQLDETARALLIDRFIRKIPLRMISAQRGVSMATVSRKARQALGELAAVLRDMGVQSADDLTVAEHFGDPGNLPASDGFSDEDLRFAADWRAAQWPASQVPALKGATLPGWTRSLRIGAFVSYLALTARDRKGKSHPLHADGWRVREPWLQIGTLARMVHPGYEFIGVVEPGSSRHGPIEGVLRDYEVYGGLIDATDVQGLQTLDVILLGNNWVMTPAIARAFHAAVRSGVGLLNDCCWTDLFDYCGSNADVRALALAESATYRFHTTPVHETPMAASIHQEHCVLPGLRPGMEVIVPSCGPVYQVMPGAQVLMSRDHVVMPQEHGLAGTGPLRPPLFVVGQLGRGRVAVINVHAHRRIMMIPGLQNNYMDNLLAWLGEPHRPASAACSKFQ